MKKYLFVLVATVWLGGCASTPYANISAGKTINVGGINVGVGVGDILHP